MVADSASHEHGEPLIIVNSFIIASGSLMQFDPHVIKSLAVYKGQDVPAILQGLASEGVVTIRYPRKVASESFAEIGKQLNLSEPLAFTLNGYQLTARQVAKLRMLPESIGQLHVTAATPEVPQTMVNIELAKSKPTEYPPGTIMLR